MLLALKPFLLFQIINKTRLPLFNKNFMAILTLFGGLKIAIQRYFFFFSLPCILLTQGFPTCGTRTTGGTRKLSKWYARCFPKMHKKCLFSQKLSHTEKCSNVNLVSVHFLLLLNCNTCKFVHIVQCCIMLRGLLACLAFFFLSMMYLQQQQQDATQSNIPTSVLHNISNNELTTG